jgi:hypothetical protein
MKNLIIIMVLLLPVITACENDIDLAPISTSSLDNFFRNEADLESAIIGAYDALQSRGQYSQSFPFLMELRADNATESETGRSGEMFSHVELFTLSTDNGLLEDAWADGYNGIQRCNVALNRMDAIEMDSNIKSIRRGELRFLRALTYFNLVRIFGEIPLVLNETIDPFDSFDQGKSTIDQIYAQIIIDLSEAVTALPSAQSEPGRATSGAANTLLGKVYLTRGQYVEAITALRTVTGYSLLVNYADIFGTANENNSESIFEVQYSSGSGSAISANGLGSGTGEGSPFPAFFAPIGDADLIGGGQTLGGNRPTMDLFSSYEATDLRRSINIGDNGTDLYPAKLVSTQTADLDSDVNSIVLRYADVVLMLAEALNEQGYVADGEAFTLLNSIRSRAGLVNLTSLDLSDQASFRLAVEEERRLELAFENHRWFDLVRTGRALTVMNGHEGFVGSISINTHQLLYPVPQREIDANPDVLTQNIGY